MLRTIIQGSSVMVQGIFVRQLADGRITIRVGGLEFMGFPVVRSSAA